MARGPSKTLAQQAFRVGAHPCPDADFTLTTCFAGNILSAQDRARGIASTSEFGLRAVPHRTARQVVGEIAVISIKGSDPEEGAAPVFVGRRLVKIRGFQKWVFVLSAAGCLLVVLWTLGAAAQEQPAVVKVTTVAGGYINDHKSATSSALQAPTDIATDSKGNLYITDSTDQRIRELTTTGVLMTIAGTGIAGYGGDGGPAKQALIYVPRGIVVDSKGNIIFSDAGNSRIRKISPSKVITTIAGTGVPGFSGDGGPATAAMINAPNGLFLDKAGNLYFADRGNQRIREVDTAGVIHTLAGNGTQGFSGDNGPALSASLNQPRGVTLDSAGNLYIADQANHRVRKVDTSGTITTFGGNGSQGCAGDGGLATSAHLGNPQRLMIYQSSLYVSNGGCSRVRAINIGSNIISTVIGSTFGFDGNGHDALSSQFNGPAGMLLDNAKANVLVVDSGNDQVRAVSVATNIVSGIAGGYTGDGLKGTKASLNAPENIAFDSKGNLYIADVYNNRVRKVTPTGMISTFAGTGISGYNGDNIPATSAELWFPYGVAVDKNDNVYISDNGNGVIRKVDTSGTITTFAQDANFTDLLGIAVDSAGNVYAADDAACVAFQVTPSGSVSVAAGVLNTCGYNADGIPATSAYLNSPYDVGVDSAGNLYIGDTFNNRVREVRGGMISTLTGDGNCGFSGDGGPATLAEVCLPIGVVTDSKNNIYFGDYGNARIREIAGGNINTIAGSGNGGCNGNGLPPLSTNIDGPSGLAVTSKGVFVADDGQYRVRKIH